MMLAVRWQAQSNQFFRRPERKLVGMPSELVEKSAKVLRPKKQRIKHDKLRLFVTLDLAVALPLGNWLFI